MRKCAAYRELTVLDSCCRAEDRSVCESVVCGCHAFVPFYCLLVGIQGDCPLAYLLQFVRCTIVFVKSLSKSLVIIITLILVILCIFIYEASRVVLEVMGLARK
jgi:hypothetical protein